MRAIRLPATANSRYGRASGSVRQFLCHWACSYLQGRGRSGGIQLRCLPQLLYASEGQGYGAFAHPQEVRMTEVERDRALEMLGDFPAPRTSASTSCLRHRQHVVLKKNAPRQQNPLAAISGLMMRNSDMPDAFMAVSLNFSRAVHY